MSLFFMNNAKWSPTHFIVKSETIWTALIQSEKFRTWTFTDGKKAQTQTQGKEMLGETMTNVLSQRGNCKRGAEFDASHEHAWLWRLVKNEKKKSKGWCNRAPKRESPTSLVKRTITLKPWNASNGKLDLHQRSPNKFERSFTRPLHESWAPFRTGGGDTVLAHGFATQNSESLSFWRTWYVMCACGGERFFSFEQESIATHKLSIALPWSFLLIQFCLSTLEEKLQRSLQNSGARFRIVITLYVSQLSMAQFTLQFEEYEVSCVHVVHRGFVSSFKCKRVCLTSCRPCTRSVLRAFARVYYFIYDFIDLLIYRGDNVLKRDHTGTYS